MIKETAAVVVKKRCSYDQRTPQHNNINSYDNHNGHVAKGIGKNTV